MAKKKTQFSLLLLLIKGTVVELTPAEREVVVKETTNFKTEAPTPTQPKEEKK